MNACPAPLEHFRFNLSQIVNFVPQFETTVSEGRAVNRAPQDGAPMRVVFAAVFCLPLVLTGCSLSPSTTETSPNTGIAIQGKVFGGNQPIVGAHVYLFAAGSSGYGGASTSLLTSTTGNPPDGNSQYYVTTGTGGTFSITGDYSCTAGQEVYLYSIGGNPGLTPNTINNSAAGLLAILGDCPGGANAFNSTIPYVVVNEVSTIAAAYSFAGFATDATHVSSPNNLLATTGVKNAFANAANLVSLGTGLALSTTPVSNGVAPQSTVNALADILASCVNTDGTVADVNSNPTACYTLFTSALSGGATGTQPTETATAAINIAHNPAANIPALYSLIPTQPPFIPTGNPVAPNDFTLGLQFTSGGVNAPLSIAIDASGNAWVTNVGTNTVTELTSSGVPATGSPYSNSSMTGLEDIAIDLSGNAWIANSISSNTGDVIELTPTGTSATNSPFTNGGVEAAYGIAIDGSSNVWVTNFNNNTVSELTSSGSAHSGSPYSAGSLSAPQSIAIDASGNAWVDNSGSASVTKLTSSGLAALNTPYSGNLNSPYGIAIDNSGDAWVPNGGSFSVTEFLSSGLTPAGSPFTGSLTNPGGVAIDGASNVWVANYLGNSVSEFNNSGVDISGVNGLGYNTGDIDLPDAIAIDSSGNVWIASLSGSGSAESTGSLTELVGAATPVVTPLAAGVKNGTLGAKP
jgi:streptogramin lyase